MAVSVVRIGLGIVLVDSVQSGQQRSDDNIVVKQGPVRGASGRPVGSGPISLASKTYRRFENDIKIHP